MSSQLAPEHAHRLQSAEARWLQSARDRLRRLPRPDRAPGRESSKTEENDR
jgi:hypothetical protein